MIGNRRRLYGIPLMSSRRGSLLARAYSNEGTPGGNCGSGLQGKIGVKIRLSRPVREIDTYPSSDTGSSRPDATAALAIPDLAALIFSAYWSGMRGDFHPPACVIGE
jgi:hypothetical protein